MLGERSDAHAVAADYSIFLRWFGESLVVDKNGAPLVVFRGEHGEILLQARAASLTFGTLEAATCYAMSPNDSRETASAPKIIPAYLRIEKPFLNNPADPFVDLSLFEEVLGLSKTVEIARRFSSFIEHTNNWVDNLANEFPSVEELLEKEPARLRSLYADAYPFLDDPVIVEELRQNGYDGAIYGGSGDTALETEFRIFSEDQMIPAVGANKAQFYFRG
jgi:hypothetical protein